MKHHLQLSLVLMALMAPLAIVACGTPEQPSTAAQPTLQQTVELVSTVAPPTELPTAAPIPTTAPSSETSTAATTAKPIPQPNAPARSCPRPPDGGASPAPNRPLGQPSIATTACPNLPAEQMPANPSAVTGATVAPSGAGTAQVIVAGATSVPGEAGTVPNNNTPTPLIGGRIIRLGDQQQTLELSVGETFELRLGTGLEWNIQIADARIVARMPGKTTDDSQGVYQALARGTTMLTATGDPPCRKSQPACMMPSIAFMLNIIVH